MARTNAIEDIVPVGVASWLLDLPKKQVDRVLDEGSLPSHLFIKKKKRRFLRSTGLAYVRFSVLEKRRLSLAFRKEVVGTMAKAQKFYWKDDHVLINLQPMQDMLLKRYSALFKAQESVVADPDIMGGELCMKGTRMPVYMVAAMEKAGTSIEDMIQNYPSLTPELIKNARIFADAYPKRGRPVEPTWRNAALLQQVLVTKKPAASGNRS